MEVGSVAVSVWPSFKGFNEKIKAEVSKVGDLGITVTGNTKKLLANTTAAVKQLEKTPVQLKIDADIKELEGKSKVVEKRIDELKKKVAADSPQLRLDITELEAKEKVARQKLADLAKQEATPQVELETAKANAELGRITTKLDALNSRRVSPEVHVELAAAQLELNRFDAELRDLEAKRATVDVDADTGAATGKLAALGAYARALVRDVHVNVDVDAGAALAKLAAVSAAAVATTIAVGGIGAASAGAIQGVVGLGAALAPAVGAVALLPAAAGAGALGIATLKTAFTGFGAAIGDDPKKAAEAMAKLAPSAREAAVAVNGLKPAWQGLQLDVQGRLFNGLSSSITSLGGTYIPILRGAMAGLASDINGSVKDAFATLKESGNVTGITIALGFLRQGLGSMSGALAPLTQAFTTLFIAGAPYIAQFGLWVQNAARAFSLFIQRAADSGQITVWINNAIFVFQQLWAVVSNVGSILGSVFTAANAAGGNFLQTLARVTGELAAGLKTPAGAEMLRTFFENLRATVDAAMPGFRVIGTAIATLVTTLAPVLPLIGGLFTALVVAAAPLVTMFSQLAGLILPPLVSLLTWLVPILAPIAFGIGAIVAALYAWRAIQTVINVVTAIWNALLLANPLGLVVLAIVGLVAALVYCYYRFEAFRNIIQGAWTVISTVAMWAWTSVLQPIFSAIGTAVMAVGQFFVWLWQTVIVPAWNAITAAISWAWNTIIFPVLTAIGTALAYLGTAIAVILVAPFVIAWNVISAIVTWAWNTIIAPIFNAIVAFVSSVLAPIFSWLWNAVIVPVWQGISNAIMFAWGFISGIFNAIVNFIRAVLAVVFQWLWINVILPVWTGIQNAIAFAWGFISGIFNAIVNFLRGVLGPVFQWLYNNIILPVWNAISNAIQGAWNFIRGVFDVLKGAVQAVGQAFQNVADWIGRAWAAIREAARAPVKWVVDVVYNNGIMPLWNGLAGIFNLGRLGPIHMATGGVIPGYQPGKDSVPAMLSRGEGVLVPEAVRGLGGPGFVGAANAFYSKGRSKGGAGTPQQGGRGYSRGGIAHFAGGGIVDTLLDWGAAAGRVMIDPVGAIKGLFSGVVGDGNRTPGSGPYTDGLKQIPGKVIDGAIAAAKKWIADMMAGGLGPLGSGAPFYTKEIARASMASGVGPQGAVIGVATAIVESAMKMYANRKVPASLGFPHDAVGSDHDSVGLFQQRQAGWGTLAQRMNAFGSAMLFFNKLRSFNWRAMEPGAAAQRVQVSAFPGRYSGRMGQARGLLAAHAGFDSGGIARGKGFMPKNTIKPERVLNPQQTMAFDSLIPLLDDFNRGRYSNPSDDFDFAKSMSNGETNVNIYPRENQSEMSIGLAAARRLEWEGRAQ